MKRKYLYVGSFFVFVLVLAMLYRSGNMEVRRRESKEQAGNTQTVDTVKEWRISASTKYVVESYDGTTGVSTSEERPVPAEIAGMTRREMEEYVREYNQSSRVDVREEEPDQIELISFSKEKVVLREIYEDTEMETGFYLKIAQGELVIYHNDQVTPYENTGILAEVLPEEERARLEEGYYVKDEKELYAILENLSS